MGPPLSGALLASLSLTFAASDLDLSVESGGANVVQVAPGAAVSYDVVGELSDALNEGLAGFRLDLEFSGGALSAADAPSGAPMDHFAKPLGLDNPAGFGGTGVAGRLVQVGGMQNTINDLFVPTALTGPVLTGIAQPGSPQTLVAGSLQAPGALGSYTLAALDVEANVIRQGETGVPFWAVDPSLAGAVTDLTVEVVALSADVESLSLSAPGTQTFSLHAGAAHASKPYILAGTFSGTTPGLPIGPFGLVWPLNFDDLTLLGFTNANIPPYTNNFASLDTSGEATAALTLPSGLKPALVGTVLHHSFVTIFGGGTGIDLASNAVPVLLTL